MKLAVIISTAVLGAAGFQDKFRTGDKPGPGRPVAV
jgi:hypothetical protein